MQIIRALILFFLFSLIKSDVIAKGNDSTSLPNTVTEFPNKIFRKVNSQVTDINKNLEDQTRKYLIKLGKQEAKLKKALFIKDSVTAKYLFTKDPEEQYQVLVQKFKKDSSQLSKMNNCLYLPNLDTLHGVISFLSKNAELLNSKKIAPAKIQESLIELQQLQSKMLSADQIEKFIQQRKEQIRNFLSQYVKMPSSISKIYNEYEKQQYYYTQQVQEYKDLLNDPDKMKSRAFELLNKLPAFTSFMKKNSFLAGLFDVPQDYGSLQSMYDLQTRSQVLASIQTRVSSGASNAMVEIGKNLESAQDQLQQLKSRLKSFGTGGENVESQNFKPNNQKTKTFLKRLEFGLNMQNTKATGYFPSTTDIGLSLGYKVSNKSILGIGSSCNFGWGTSINHIHFTSQGLSLRSFIDVQIKMNIYISGGFEETYTSQFNSFSQLKNISLWQRSGLVGISKTVSLPGKTIKKTKVQLLWDFLSYTQAPATQPIIFRFGYNF